MFLKDNSDNKLFTRKNIRDGSLVIGFMVGIIAFATWYIPISALMVAQPILNKLDNAVNCPDVIHADIQQFMIPMMIAIDPITSKKVDTTFQEKAHIYCADLYKIEKKYGDISDSSKMTCDDLRIVIKSFPSDMIKSSVTNDYVSRCLT